ncbi:cold-shock protein [uncultured Limosilactobacillus sp.]|uniref:cold-shock protein n=1 Tax=uncultured Limosilactobacillus sp. TaxID=2837629 RepID=UPI0025E06F1A|nr:cold shock domain-containing protein [uncultured Limosilactobacillus sp.]
MITGKITKYDQQKGNGMIQTPQDGEIFFRKRSIENLRNQSLTFGQLMGFVIVEGKYGPQAAHIKVIN